MNSISSYRYYFIAPTNECALDSCFSENQFDFFPFNSVPEITHRSYHIEKTLPLGSWTWCTGGVDLMGWKVNLQPKLMAESLMKDACTIGLEGKT